MRPGPRQRVIDLYQSGLVYLKALLGSLDESKFRPVTKGPKA